MVTYSELMNKLGMSASGKPHREKLKESCTRTSTSVASGGAEQEYEKAFNVSDLEEAVNLIPREDADLHEGILKAGAVTVFSTKSRSSGVAAARHFTKAVDAIRKKSGRDDDSRRIERVEEAVFEIAMGLLRFQESHTQALSANVAGHLLEKPVDRRPTKR